MPLSALTKIGLGKETSWGSGGTPTVLLPVNPPSFTVPFEQILDNALRGIPARDFAAYQGPGSVEGTIEGPFYPEELGYILLALMGSVTTTGTAAPYTHEFLPDANPPTLFFQDETGIEEYQYRGCYITEFSLSWNAAEGLLNYSASISGKDRTIVGPAVPADATNPPFRNCVVTVEIGGVQYPAAMEGEITCSREIALVYGGDGSCVPNLSYVGPLEVTASMTLDFRDPADYERYINKTQEAVKITWSQGTGPDLKQLIFESNVMDFGEGPVELDRSGIHVTLAYSMRALYDATLGGPCKFTLVNAQAGY